METKKFCYQYPHPAVTADSVIFGFDGKRLHLLLIERGLEPYRGMWALPGGFIRMNETVEQCAARELFEETGLRNVYMEQFGTFSDVHRDPRERVITVAFLALVSKENYTLLAGDDAARAEWFLCDELPPLAFDHKKIIAAARERLTELLKLKPVAFKLLGKEFKMSELQNIYEVINGTQYDRRNFHRKMLASGFVVESNDRVVESDVCYEKLTCSCFAAPKDDEICCDMAALPMPKMMSKGGKPQKSGVQRFSFDEDAYKREERRGWRKYPFDF